MIIASSDNLSIFRFEYFTTYFTKKELIELSEIKKEFICERKREDVSENNVEKDESLVIDFSILTEKKNEKDFIIYIYDILKKREKKKVILEKKEIMNEKEIKNTLIRYYVFSRNIKKIIKIEINENEIDKDIENNYYLPTQILDLIEENQIKNILNIHRIKNIFNFLEPTSISINFKLSNAEKYLKEYLE